jgi:hypothetical protein
MIQEPIIVKTNYYGDFRRFTVDKEIEYTPFVTVLQTLYDDKFLLPPSTHNLKYVDEDGDSITVVTSNELKLAISYFCKLTRPILRLSIEKKLTQNGSQAFSSTTSHNPTTQASTVVTPTLVSSPSTPVSFPTLKIEGRAVQRPTEIKERYGPKKDPLPTLDCDTNKGTSNSNDNSPVDTNKNGENNSVDINKSGENTFSCQNFSEETRKKNTENSNIITSSQKQLAEQTAKEIDQFANDISKSFKNIAHNSNISAEKRGSAEKEALTENSGFQSAISCSNLTFPEHGFDVTESTFAKFKGLSLLAIDEQAKEIVAIKEHHMIESDLMKKKAKHLHDSTVSLVQREGSSVI